MERYSDIGTCYRDRGILCTENECGWCDTIRHDAKETKMTVNLESMRKDQSVWEVSFIDRFSRHLVNANTFLEAVEEAKKIAVQKKIPLEDIKSVHYLMY